MTRLHKSYKLILNSADRIKTDSISGYNNVILISAADFVYIQLQFK